MLVTLTNQLIFTVYYIIYKLKRDVFVCYEKNSEEGN